MTFYALDLKVAKEAAETAAASKQSFLANMSHGKPFTIHAQCPMLMASF